MTAALGGGGGAGAGPGAGGGSGTGAGGGVGPGAGVGLGAGDGAAPTGADEPPPPPHAVTAANVPTATVEERKNARRVRVVGCQRAGLSSAIVSPQWVKSIAC